jgi:hypothetical protein
MKAGLAAHRPQLVFHTGKLVAKDVFLTGKLVAKLSCFLLLILGREMATLN